MPASIVTVYGLETTITTVQSASTTSYYDDGLWHTYYPIKETFTSSQTQPTTTPYYHTATHESESSATSSLLLQRATSSLLRGTAVYASSTLASIATHTSATSSAPVYERAMSLANAYATGTYPRAIPVKAVVDVVSWNETSSS